MSEHELEQDYEHEHEQQARKLQATLVRNYYPVTHRVKCRATSVAKKRVSAHMESSGSRSKIF